MPFIKRLMSNAWKIFLLSLAVQIAAFFVLVYIAGINSLNFVALTGDANAYRILAENIINHGVFSVSSRAPFFPESFRSPGFPFFLAPFFGLTGNWFTVLFFHGLWASALPVLLYVLCRKIDERAAFVSAIIFTFEPTRLFLANNLLTDTLFTLSLFSSLILFWDARNSRKRVFMSGALLGFAALVRPIAVFLPLVFLSFAAGFFGLRFQNDGRRLKLSLFFLAGFILIVFPWSLRNKIIFDSWQLSSVASSNLANYNVPEFLKFSDPPYKEDALEELKKLDEGRDPLEAHSLYRHRAMNDFSLKYIKKDPFGYLKFHLLKTIPFFVTDGLRDIARTLNFSDAAPPNFSTLISRGNFRAVFAFFKNGGPELYLFLAGFSFWAAVSVLAGAAVIREIFVKSPAREAVFLFAALILYFALLTGPVSNARYRLPVSGLMIFLAVFALYTFAFRKSGAYA